MSTSTLKSLYRHRSQHSHSEADISITAQGSQISNSHGGTLRRFGSWKFGRRGSRASKCETLSTTSISSAMDTESMMSFNSTRGGPRQSMHTAPSLVFGVPLEDAVQYSNPHGRVPRPVTICVDFLNRHGLDTEGIFRVTGSARVVNQYLHEIEEYIANQLRAEELGNASQSRSGRNAHMKTISLFEDSDGLPVASVHDVAGALIKYLRMLPQELLSCPMSPQLEQLTAMVLVGHDRKDVVTMTGGQIYTMQSLLGLLSVTHRATLSLLLALFANIAANSNVNAMTASNLAICVGNTLTGNNPNLVRILIDNYREIFNTGLGEGAAANRTAVMTNGERALVAAALFGSAVAAKDNGGGHHSQGTKGRAVHSVAKLVRSKMKASLGSSIQPLKSSNVAFYTPYNQSNTSFQQS